MPKYKFQDTSLSVDERVNALLEELTLDEKMLLITSVQKEIPRLGIKAFKIGTEAARGLLVRPDKNDQGKYSEAPTTVFPEPFSLSATFDTGLMEEIGAIAATEARIYNKEGKSTLCLWAPTVDLERDPRWGRTEEGYGEDPELTGKMAAALTRGMLGNDKKYYRVIPTLKHFYANNNEEDRTADNASIPAVLKHNYYLKAFEQPIKNGGAKSLMTSYNMINGVEAICNPEVTELCKNEWGMLFSVSDAWDFIENVTRHKTDLSHTETYARIIKSGGANIITDEQDVVEAAARNALAQKLITESDIDKSLFGALKARFLLGEFDSDCWYDKVDKNLLLCDNFRKTAAKAAEESIILLRNRHMTLPLREREKIAVIGLHSDMNFRDWYTGYSEKNPTILDGIIARVGRENVNYEMGNDIIAIRNGETGFYFSVSEDGTFSCDSATINESCLLEVFDWGNGNVSFKSKFNGKFLCDSGALADNGVIKCVSDEPYGWFVKEQFIVEKCDKKCRLKNWQERYLFINENGQVEVTDKIKPKADSMFSMELFSSGFDRVRKAVTEAHNVLLVLGNHPLIGARENVDRKTLSVTERQQKLSDLVLSLNENAVLLYVSGYPYAVDSRFNSVLHTGHNGPEMGTALAKVLFGEISPAGRCPMTWYASENELGSIKDYNIIRTESTYRYYCGEPVFPFGHGLSYTAFRYSALKLNKKCFEPNERCEVTFEIRNIGNFDSDEVVQLYVKSPEFSSAVPFKELKAFKRVFVPTEKAVPIMLSFDIADLALWDLNKNCRTVFAGTYEIQVGSSSEEILRTVEIKVHGDNYQGLDIKQPVPATASWEYVGVEFQTDKQLNEYALLANAQSSITFENCAMKGERNVEIIVSNPATKTKVLILEADKNEVLAEIEVPTTGSLSNFAAFTAIMNPISGKHKLKIKAGGILSLKSFRLF